MPAYNERSRIVGTLTAIRAHLEGRGGAWEIIVAADGTDGTREAASEWAGAGPRIKVIGSPARRGKGRGVREGVALATGVVVGFADADEKTPIEEMEKLLPWLDQGFDLVIGSRGVAGSRIERAQPLHRMLGSRAFGLGMHLLLNLWNIRDTQCGFKFFSGPVARDLFGRQRIDGYMFDVEILHLAVRAGYRVKEGGVRWRDDGDSRLDLVAGNWRNFVDILRIRFAGSSPVRAAAPPAASPDQPSREGRTSA